MALAAASPAATVRLTSAEPLGWSIIYEASPGERNDVSVEFKEDTSHLQTGSELQSEVSATSSSATGGTTP